MSGTALIETAGQALILALGYGIGAGVLIGLLRLFGLPFPFTQTAAFVLTLPLVATLVAEAFTGLWQHTPGTMGLGGLTAFVPMLVAGALVVAVTFAAQAFLAPFDPSLPRHAPTLTAWVAIAAGLTLATLALWRFWPEPTARLFL